MSLACSVFNVLRHKVLPLRLVQNTFAYSTSKTPTKDGNCETKPKKKTKTPKGLLDDNFDDAQPVFKEKEPLQSYPNNVHPKTGEVGGPKGKHIYQKTFEMSDFILNAFFKDQSLPDMVIGNEKEDALIFEYLAMPLPKKRKFMRKF